MSQSRRVQRVEKELQHIVANYLLKGFKGRLCGLVSVSRVEANAQLRTAKVYVSVLGSDEDRRNSLESLQQGTHEIQQHVNKQLRMKFVPRISLILDEGLEKLLRVESLLRQVSAGSSSKSSRDEE